MLARTVVAGVAAVAVLFAIAILMVLVNALGNGSKALGAFFVISAVFGAVWFYDWYTTPRPGTVSEE